MIELQAIDTESTRSDKTCDSFELPINLFTNCGVIRKLAGPIAQNDFDRLLIHPNRIEKEAQKQPN